LRAERERASISLDAVERGTMIRRDFLELIDVDRLEELPSGAYAKGFIRAYAAYVGLDATPLVKSYDDRYAPATSELANVVGRPVRVPPDRQRRTWKIAVGTAAAVLVLLAPATPLFRRLRLAAVIAPEHPPPEPEESPGPSWVGREGRTLTDLRPTGFASFEGKRVEVLSEGPFIPVGRAVVAVRMAGTRPIVREREES
jgi:hypothetical protein